LNCFEFDSRFRKDGVELVGGIDEAGRGCVAGPVVAASVVLSSGFKCEQIKDSKLLTAAERHRYSCLIKEKAVCYSIAFASHLEVDRYNVLRATYLAMRRSFVKLKRKPDILLIDGPRAPVFHSNQRCIVDGDAKSLAVASASILAKVFRDRFMNKYHSLRPNYCFAKNKGYLTLHHKQALKIFGPCKIHRMTYAPVREICFNEKLLV